MCGGRTAVVELGFELLDENADRGLGQVQMGGGEIETAEIGHSDERLNLLQGHVRQRASGKFQAVAGEIAKTQASVDRGSVS